MQRTVWKSADEIRFSLQPFKRIAVFSCGVCANLSGTGGHRGLKIIRNQLEAWDKQIVTERVVVACCAEEIMRQAVQLAGITPGRCDAMVVLSCAGGIKSAALSSPHIPVIPAARRWPPPTPTTSPPASARPAATASSA